MTADPERQASMMLYRGPTRTGRLWRRIVLRQVLCGHCLGNGWYLSCGDYCCLNVEWGHPVVCGLCLGKGTYKPLTRKEIEG